jgi:hypothetical protein
MSEKERVRYAKRARFGDGAGYRIHCSCGFETPARRRMQDAGKLYD